MAFPINPDVGDLYTDANGTVWMWNGVSWSRKSVSKTNETLYGPKFPLGGDPGQVLTIDSNGRKVWQTQVSNFATIPEVDSRILAQLGNNFSNRTVLLNTNTSVFADGEAGLPDPNEGPGWYYKNTESNKINWYFYGGASATGYQLSSFDGWYAVIEIRATGSFPYLTVYTAPTGSGDYSWYKSRLNYVDESTTAALAPGLYLFHTAGLDVTGIYDGLTRVSLPVGANSVGTQAGTESLWLMALSTSSNLPAGTNEFVVREQAVVLGGVTTNYQHVALPTYQAPYSEYYKGSYTDSLDFPESGRVGQWLIHEVEDVIYIWDSGNGEWVASGVAPSGEQGDEPLLEIYDPAVNDHGVGFANASGDWDMTLGGSVRPRSGVYTSSNRIMLGRITEPGDTLIINGISAFTSNMVEFALVAALDDFNPGNRNWAGNRNWTDARGQGWTAGGHGQGGGGGEESLSVIGGTANRWSLGGKGNSWTQFTGGSLYHRDNISRIDTEIRFRLCETGYLQLHMGGTFIAESTLQVTAGVGAEIWLFAPEGREYPAPVGELDQPLPGISEPSTVNARSYMTTVDPTGGAFVTVIESGNGYWLYTAGDPVNPESVNLDTEEAEAARYSRVFVDYTGMTLEERAQSSEPVMIQDDLVLDRVEFLARGYFHTLDLTLPEIQDKMSLYEDALAAAKAGSVELCLATLQSLNIPTAGNSGSLAFTPNYTFDGTNVNTASQDYYSGDALYDTYGIDELDFSDSFVTIHFKDSASFNAWRSQDRELTIDYPSGSKVWEGTHTLTTSMEYSVSYSYNYIHYQPTSLPNDDREDLADTLASAGAGTSVINVTLGAPTPQAPADALGEADVVNQLISTLQVHLQKFPR